MASYKLRIEGLILTYVAIYVHTKYNLMHMHLHMQAIRQSRAQAILAKYA